MPSLETNSTSSVPSSSHGSNFAELLSDAELPPPREGLPTGFRMRASAHYVDQLDTAPRPTLRAIAVSAIEADAAIEAPDALIASVREFGVLEPLLVQNDPRGRQFRLIAGRARLAAARAAGLRDVPCVVHTLSDEAATAMSEATRGTRPRDERAPANADPGTSLYPAQREIESALTTIASCAPLLEVPSALARHSAVQVIGAESRRAQRMLKAMTVLGTGVAVRRAVIKAAGLFTRLQESFQEERRLLGSDASVSILADPQLSFYGDADLLLTAMTSGLAALTAAAGERPRELSLTAGAGTAPGTIALDVSDHSVIVSESFVRTAFTAPWPVPDGDAALLLLQAARAIARAHGGSLSLASDPAARFRLQLPGQ